MQVAEEDLPVSFDSGGVPVYGSKTRCHIMLPDWDFVPLYASGRSEGHPGAVPIYGSKNAPNYASSHRADPAENRAVEQPTD